MKIHALSVLCALCGGLLAVAGCGDSATAERVRNLGANVLSTEAVFQSAAELLNSLDQACDVQLEKTTVLVDSTMSLDQKPILAVVADNPNLPGRQFNWLVVPAKNVDFNRAAVQPRCVVNIFAASSAERVDTEFERQMLANFGRRGSIGLRVARVVDAHTLELETPLNQELTEPTPIVVTKQYNQKLDLALDRLLKWQNTGQPAVGWEPTPDEDGLDRLVAQLNQWLDQQEPELKRGNDAPGTVVSARRFTREDGRLLQEAVWLRDVARRAAAQSEPLDQAKTLFDWVVRNVQLETTESMGGIRQRPWQALISGRGTADERAWVFVLLARQARLDARPFALPDANEESAPRLWTVGVEVGGQWYLFDPTLGLPIPGPDGKGVATLAEAKQSERVLKQLDVDSENVYPVKAGNLAAAIGLIETTRLYRNSSAEAVEAQLAGEQRVILSAPTGMLAKLEGHVAKTQVWDIADKTLAAQSKMSPAMRAYLAEQYRSYAYVPLLWKGRVLQLKGNTYRWEYDFNDRRVRTYSRFQDPKVYYLNEYCCPPNEFIAAIEPSKPEVATAFRFAQRNARYWLGLITYEEGDYPVALNHFEARTLKAAPEGPWKHGAHYNLARTHEEIARSLRQLREAQSAGPIELPTVLAGLFDGKTTATADELTRKEAEHVRAAKSLYEEDDSPQRHGNRLRGKWLPSRSLAPNP